MDNDLRADRLPRLRPLTGTAAEPPRAEGTLDPMSSDQHGMGPTPHGPEFAPPSAPAQPQLWQPGAPGGRPPSGSRGPRIEPPRPPKNRLATWLTIGVIGLVSLTVVLALVWADRQAERRLEEQSGRPDPSASTPSSLPSTSADSITFKSAEGEGRLTLVSHRWTSSGVVPPDNGQYLQVTLRIDVTDGAISYGPQYFQTFDAKGELFQTTEAGSKQPMLDEGIVAAGDSVSGNIAFDMPRGQVTLLMSNAMLRTVTALKISD